MVVAIVVVHDVIVVFILGLVVVHVVDIIVDCRKLKLPHLAPSWIIS